MTAAAPSVDQPARDDQVVVQIGQHDEAFADQLSRCREQPFVVGEERPFVAYHFELHPGRVEHFSREHRGPYSLLGRITAGGVGEELVFFRVYVIQQRLFRTVIEVHAPDGDRYHIRPGCRERLGHKLESLVLTRAQNQTRGESSPGYY